MFNKIVFVTIFLFTISYANKNLTIMTELLAPISSFNTKEQKLKGIAVKIVKKILEDINYTNKIYIQPWDVAYDNIKYNKNKIIIAMVKTKQREDLFKWVGPIININSNLYKRSNDNITIKNYNDAKKVKYVTVVSKYPEYEILKSMDFDNLFEVYSVIGSIRGLINNRVDLITVGDIVLDFSISQAQIDNTLIKNTNLLILSNKLYIAFSRDVSDDIINKWQKSLNKLIKSGIYKKEFIKSFNDAKKYFNIKKEIDITNFLVKN
jgi:ABC-type amino acid transport substrate-binding protein